MGTSVGQLQSRPQCLRQGAVSLGALAAAGSVTCLRVTLESFGGGVGRLKKKFIKVKLSTEDGGAMTPTIHLDSGRGSPHSAFMTEVGWG